LIGHFICNYALKYAKIEGGARKWAFFGPGFEVKQGVKINVHRINVTLPVFIKGTQTVNIAYIINKFHIE